MPENESEISIVRSLLNEGHLIKVTSIIRTLGLAYEERDMAEGDSGRLERCGGNYRVVVNKNDGEQRRRFTAAHELAHYLLHRDLIQEHGHLDRLFSDDSEGPDPTEPLNKTHEIQANKLAAEIMLPRKTIEMAYDRQADNVRELADQFHVSLKAMDARLKSLGLRTTADAHSQPGVIEASSSSAASS